MPSKLHRERYRSASAREGKGELTLRESERGAQKVFIDPSQIDKKEWRPPLVDEDGAAICQVLSVF